MEAVCLVVDCGPTASAEIPGGSFLARALQCASSFVERKLYSESKDMLGTILFGCQDTSNPLDYPGVKIVGGGLTQADWDTVSFLREQVRGSEVPGDWVDALVVACDFLKSESERKKFSALKIVLFSELGCAADTDSDQIELIIQGMKLLDNIDFTHIGPDWGDDDLAMGEVEGQGPDSQGGAGPSKLNGCSARNDVFGWPPGKPRSQAQRQNEELVGRLVHETDGMICTLDEALASFLFKSKKKQRPAPWKVDFEVGPDIRITTSGFIALRRAPPKTWSKCLARPATGEEELELKADVTFVRNNEEQEEVDDDNMVVAYRYGPEMVVISREDEEAARHKGEDGKKLQLFGFLSRELIRPCDLVGDGCMVFLPQESDPNSEAALAALSEAMLQLGVVAIVRKAYRKGLAARLGVMVPEPTEDGGISLIFIDLPFAEEVRDLSFPSLPQPSDAQLSAMDDLIDVMMLTQGEGEERVEVLKTEDTLNPSNQYLYQVLTERATRPGCIIPPPADHISTMLQPPSEIRNAMMPVAERMKELFTTEEVVKAKTKRTAEVVLGKDGDGEEPETKRPREDLEMEASIAEVGSVTPVEDFRVLVGRGEALEGVALQLERVVMRLLATAFGGDMDSKVIACLAVYREEAARRRRPDLYNVFIRKVKESIGGKGRLWMGLVEAKLGLLEQEGLNDLDTFLLPPSQKSEPLEPEDDEDLLDQL